MHSLVAFQGPAWCHATATDLVHWVLESEALAPYASSGGTVQLNDTTFAAIFGTASGEFRAAYSSDEMLARWAVGPEVIADTQPGDTVAVWWQPPSSISALVSTCNGNCSAPGAQPVFALFNGTSLASLQFVRDVYTDPAVQGRAQYGDYFTAESADVLLFTTPEHASVVWRVGSTSGAGDFVPSISGMADAGDMRASASFSDLIGRRITFGVVHEPHWAWMSCCRLDPGGAPADRGSNGGRRHDLPATDCAQQRQHALVSAGAGGLAAPRTRHHVQHQSDPAKHGLSRHVPGPARRCSRRAGGDFMTVVLTGVPDALQACQNLCCSLLGTRQ